jgi:agmatine deiminase
LQSYRIYENIFGFGVGGHIDEFARFANRNTILLAFPDEDEAATDPIKLINLERMKANYSILQASKNEDGNAFDIVKVPIPEMTPEAIVIDTTKNQGLQVFVIRKENPQLHHGDTVYFLPAVSYLNFIVLNNIVIIPQYWKPGASENCRKKDEEVKVLFTKLYPDKEIIQLSPLGLNYGGGGFHCWTQQVPY